LRFSCCSFSANTTAFLWMLFAISGNRVPTAPGEPEYEPGTVCLPPPT
jgi:hypothetical protein